MDFTIKKRVFAETRFNSMGDFWKTILAEVIAGLILDFARKVYKLIKRNKH